MRGVRELIEQFLFRLLGSDRLFVLLSYIYLCYLVIKVKLVRYLNYDRIVQIYNYKVNFRDYAIE